MSWPYANCLIFALYHWYRYGGYLIVRRSHFGPLPHFLWASKGALDQVSLKQYVPDRSKRKWWEIWKALIFKGKVRTDDR